ncbi:MAG: SDR family oxidoreductase [Deltaproteobacteria bacterium]|nr:SDR family oxidoreductase [Deltaproteobacteria bacterium]
MNISESRVLVTGASKGLGRALAGAMAREGAKVVMIARGKAELDAAVDDVRARGGEAHGLAFDVGDKEAVHRIAGAAAALVGDIDVVVHAASTLGPLPMPLLLDTACEDLERVIAVNVLGPFRLTKAFAGPMVLRQRGLVIFVSSDAAVSAYARWGSYGVTKAAADHLARTFAAELDPVRFLAVDPGEMDTQMHADAMPDADRASLARPDDVAARLLTIVERAESIANGSRLLAADVPPRAASLLERAS